MMRKFEALPALLALAACCAYSQGDPQGGSPQGGNTQDPPFRVARLNYLSGTVSFRPGTVEEWAPATLNYPLYNGDHLWSDTASRTELHIGSTAMRMGSESALAILNLTDNLVQLSLTGGALQIHLRSLGPNESFEIDTPNAAITLLRAGDYHFFVDPDRNLTAATVRSGDAEVTAGGRAMTLHARDTARLTGIDATFDGQLELAAPPDDLEMWSQARDRREEQSQSVRYTSREMIGYEDLDANGSWRQMPGYGWVWTPRVSAGWAPYHYGHWVWAEPWGWTWVDDAPWGFAPFHYGRWAQAGGMWFWVPGTVVARPVYAPALVAFVGGPRFSLAIGIGGGGAGVAWFPLGPHEVYRPAYHVSNAYVTNVNITHVNVTNINVTNVNVTNVRYVNQTVPGAVTAVPQAAFVGARPVHQASIAVSASSMSQAQVQGSAQIAPERASVLGHQGGMAAAAAPPARFGDRAVVARTPPPPPPASFASRQTALRANPGRPLDPATADSLRRAEPVRPQMVRPATPAAAPAPTAGRQFGRPQGQQPQGQPSQPQPQPQAQPQSQPAIRDNAAPRNDRPRPAQPTVTGTTPTAPQPERRAPEPQTAQPHPATPAAAEAPRSQPQPRAEPRSEAQGKQPGKKPEPKKKQDEKKQEEKKQR
jgi:hypothetical protein